MTVANNGLGFFHGPSLAWEQLPAAVLAACCQGLPGSPGRRFPFRPCFSAFSGSVLVDSSSSLVFTQITQQCLPVTVVLKRVAISRFTFQSGNLIPQSGLQS